MAANARLPGTRSSLGEKANQVYGPDTWLPDDTTNAILDYGLAIKGPLTTPVGGGIRSINVRLRQLLDLYACVRPVRWYEGVPSPMKDPGKLDVVIFRENTEDVYSGIEFEQGTPEARKVIDFFNREMGQVDPRRFGYRRQADQRGPAPNAWFAGRSNTRSITVGRASRWSTRAIS